MIISNSFIPWMMRGRKDTIDAMAGLHSLCVTVLCAMILTFAAAPSANAGLPAVKNVSGTLTSPSAADTYYGSATTHTNGLCGLNSIMCSLPRPTAIVELARTLSRGGTVTTDQFATNVFEYVYKNVDTEFRYGLSKGAFGALLDQSGTPFDQANLLVELLRQGAAAYPTAYGTLTATYQAGTITLSGTQFSAWTGLTNAAVACQYLANGGIPASVNGSTPASCSTLTGTVSSVVMSHIWISANGKLYDPSYKTYTQKTGIDLAAAMGCGTAAAPTCGSSAKSAAIPAGGTYQGYDATAQANYVQNVQYSALGTTLNGFATNLQHYIEANLPTAKIEDVVGGQKIDPSQMPTPGASLSYTSSVQHSWTGDIPNQYRSRLNVQFDNINIWLYADETYGYWLHLGGVYSGTNNRTRHVALFFEREMGTQIANTPNLFSYFDNLGTNQVVPLATSTKTAVTSPDVPMTIVADHPYAAGSGSYMDETFARSVHFYGVNSASLGSYFVSPVLIVQAWGRTGIGSATRALSEAASKSPTNWVGAGIQRTFYGSALPGAPTAPAQAGGYQAVTVPSHFGGLETWLSEAGLSVAIIDAINGTKTQEQHTVGILTEDHDDGISGTPDPVSASVDAPTDVSVVSINNSAPPAQKSFAVTASTYNALEGGAFEQVDDMADGGNSVRWFELTNEQGNRFFETNQGNVNSVLSATVNYTPHISGDPKQIVRDYINLSGPQYNMIVPRNGSVGTWTDPGGPTLTYIYTPLLGYATDASQLAFLTSNGLKGSSADVAATDPVVEATKFEHKVQAEHLFDYQAGVSDGSLKLTPEPDLKTGEGTFPESLSYQRFYDSNDVKPVGCRNIPDDALYCSKEAQERLFLGWTDNFQISATFANDGYRGLGEDEALDASRSIAAFFSLSNLASSPSFQNYIASIFFAAWFQDRLEANSIVIRRPPNAYTFIKLPDGRFNARNGSTGSISTSATRTRNCCDPGGFQIQYSNTTIQWTDADGAVTTFSAAPGYPSFNGYKPDTWSFANGEKIRFSYIANAGGGCPNSQDDPYPTGWNYCLSSVSNSHGRSLTFANAQDAAGFTVTDDSGRVVAIHQSDCLPDGTPPSMDVHLPNGAIWKSSFVSFPFTISKCPLLRLSGIFTPESPSSPYLSFSYDGLDRISSATDANSQVTTYYPASVGAQEQDAKGSVVDALGNVSEQYFDDMGRLLQSKDPLGRITTLAYDGLGRLSTKTMPEGDYATYAYDVRSNLLSTVLHPKPGSAEATASETITTSTTYGEGPTVLVCSNPKICNKPLTSTNGNGKVTNYTINGTTGLLTQVLLPADPSGTRPQTNYGYTATTIGSDSVNLLTSKTEKINASTSTVTAYTYNASNKYVLQASVVDSGSGHLNLTSTYTFDTMGNLTQIDGPRTDVSDLQNFTWDSNRRPLFSIGVDPDGAGAKKRVATKNTYNLNGWVTQVDTGTTTSATGSDFVSSLAVTNSYDAMGHKTKTATPTAVTQYAYDADERLWCSTVRLNTASYPSGACSLGTAGAYGYDRITRYVYDVAGQVINEQRALSVSGLQQNYATYTYTNNGKQASVYDALGTTHKTQYAYDGFDRLKTTTFPGSTTEALTYDNDSNVLTRKNRAGQTLTYTYDNLDRLRTKAVPAVGSIPANTVTWTYDLVSEPTSITDTLGNMLTDVFDLAKRKTSSARVAPGLTGSQTLTYKYDQGGNRTSLVWPDNYCVNYQYDSAGRLTWVTEGTYAAPTCTASTTLATYDYDTLGRRAYVQYGNNAKQSYTWSTEGDLNSLAQDFNGTANDVSFTDTFNPAHQLATATITNPAFKFVIGASGTDSYGAVNVLNQYPTVTPAGSGAQTITYDSNGNLTGDGTWTFAYDPENRLMTANKTGTAAAYAYDPLERRTKKAVNSVSTFFLQDGNDEIGEYTAAGVIQRRFVPGDTIDEPIIMIDYTIAGNPKTYFHKDKQGSTIAMTDASGNLVEGPYKYDGYGNGAPTTGVPFKYTGRRLDPETGLYYYRARYYSASLGRFLQTDPVGYKDNLLAYAYVGEDPMNNSDPTGNFGLGLDAFIVDGEIGYDAPSGEFFAAGRVGINLSPGPYIDLNPSGIPAQAQNSTINCNCRVTWSEVSGSAGVSAGPYWYQPISYEGDTAVTTHDSSGKSETSTYRGNGLSVDLGRFGNSWDKARQPTGRKGNPLNSHKNPKMKNPFIPSGGINKEWGTTFRPKEIFNQVLKRLVGQVEMSCRGSGALAGCGSEGF